MKSQNISRCSMLLSLKLCFFIYVVIDISVQFSILKQYIPLWTCYKHLNEHGNLCLPSVVFPATCSHRHRGVLNVCLGCNEFAMHFSYQSPTLNLNSTLSISCGICFGAHSQPTTSPYHLCSFGMNRGVYTDPA